MFVRKFGSVFGSSVVGVGASFMLSDGLKTAMEIPTGIPTTFIKDVVKNYSQCTAAEITFQSLNFVAEEDILTDILVINDIKRKVKEIHEKDVLFQVRKTETRDFLLKIAAEMDEVTKKDRWFTVSSTGVSFVGGILTVVGGALVIATHGAALPLLIAGGVVGGVGGAGGIVGNVLLENYMFGQLSSAETAMDELKGLEEEMEVSVTNLAEQMELMTINQRELTQEIIFRIQNTTLNKFLEILSENNYFHKGGKTKDMVGTASIVIGAASRPVIKKVSSKVLDMSAKTFGKAAGGITVGVGAVFLISDGVTMAKTIMEVWNDKPEETPQILREIAKNLNERYF